MQLSILQKYNPNYPLLPKITITIKFLKFKNLNCEKLKFENSQFKLRPHPFNNVSLHLHINYIDKLLPTIIVHLEYSIKKIVNENAKYIFAMCFASKPLFSIRDWATLLAIAVSSV